MFVFIVITLQIISLTFRAGYIIIKKTKDPFSPYLDLCSGLLLLSELIYRSILIQFPAILNIYEILILLLSFFLIVLCFIQFSKKVNSTPYFPLISGILVIFLLVFTVVPGIYRDVSRPVPILKSLWLILHVTFSVIGEAFFFLAFITSVLLLVSKTTNKINQYDTLTSLFTIAGFFFFTTGALIFGAIWAQQAWGSYWSWDPKETWALITGLVYTLYLHLKYIRKVKTKFLAFVSIGGFIFTLFTLFGVSCFFKGFHSY